MSNQKLTQFYEEWICQTGHPIISYKLEQEIGKIKLKFTQNQAENFHFSLEFLVLYDDNTSESKTLVFNDKESNLEWATTKRVSSLRLDPNFKLLFEEKK